ncbi:hypothetical protein [Ruegeria atlantica]|uniref:hypothetical protein n=1 Tax=Ruegeria atlantica TaxID=81569 RepID=UPI00071DFD76|nr:hypothetical protein [Ruegeria atlantica]
MVALIGRLEQLSAIKAQHDLWASLQAPLLFSRYHPLRGSHVLALSAFVSPNLIEHIGGLLMFKSKAKEIGRGQRIATIDDFIQDQMAREPW